MGNGLPDLRYFAIIVAAIAAGACGGAEQPVADQAANGQEQLQEPKLEGWGPKLLSLIPDRGSDAIPSVAAVRQRFGECGLSTGTSPAGRCDLAAKTPSPDSSDPSVGIEVRQSGDEVRSIHLTACCSPEEDFFRPIETQPVIRSELICPELTIVASESVQAFRGSASGTRDFIFVRTVRDTDRGRSVGLTLLLSPVEAGTECATLSEAQTQSGF